MIRGLETTKKIPSYLRKFRNSEWFWSGQSWLGNLVEDLPEVKPFITDEVCRKVNEIRGKSRAIQEAFKTPSWIGEEEMKKVCAIKLWSIQKQAARIMAYSKRFYLTDDVGLGKTFSSFAALILLKEWGLIKKAVVVTTASVKYQWASEIRLLIKKKYRKRYDTVVVDGLKSKRMEAYKKKAFVHVVNYESLRIDSEGGRINPFGVRVDAIILDEASKLQNIKSLAHKAVAAIFRDCPYRFALNATPMGNGYHHLFGVFKIIDPLVFVCWDNFEHRYMTYKKVRIKKGNKRLTIMVPDNRAFRHIGDLKGRTRGKILRRTDNDQGVDVPKISIIPYWITLHSEQLKAYKAIRNSRDMNPLEKIVRARIACLFKDKKTAQKSPKYRELVQLLKEVVPHKKVIVFSESRKFLEGIIDGLKKEKFAVTAIAGGMSVKKREERKDAFVNGNIRVLLLTAAGESGLNLQAADVLINLDLPWSADRLRQRVGRLRPHLGGKDRHLKIINILARSTIEERVVERIQEKVGRFSDFFSEEQLDLTGVLDNPKTLERML